MMTLAHCPCGGATRRSWEPFRTSRITVVLMEHCTTCDRTLRSQLASITDLTAAPLRERIEKTP